VVLALGGGSWARLGSNGPGCPGCRPWRGGGAALPTTAALMCRALERAFRQPLCGQPFKSVAISLTTSQGVSFSAKASLSPPHRVEGSLIYAASSLLRDDIIRNGQATLHLDLLPDMPPSACWRSAPSTRLAFALQPPQKPSQHRWHQGAMLHELLSKEQCRPVQLPRPSRPAITLVRRAH